ncbi:MAG: hypothetical protein WCK34_02865 [Bacteroidota bacterium]
MKKIVYLLVCFYVVSAVLTIVFFSGTGDAGDSIMHYLFARYAPVHPELFFDHWAKPLFVLLASPFAQFGLNGIKTFNALVSLAAIILTFKTAESLNIKNGYISMIIMIFAPLYYILTFSGLTEPLFALAVAAGLYLAVRGNFAASSIMISFLPYIRSEGLIIIGVFGLYFLLKKQWRVLPLLLAGSLFYSIAGYTTHHDLLWVFDRIPYATLSSAYGSGTLTHFAEQMFYVVGFPVYFLFIIGFLNLLRTAVAGRVNPEEHILVFLGFFCFFLAHSLFWYFGIFNSMGLKRVMIGVMPMIAIIALQGFNLLTEEFIPANRRTLKMVLQGIIAGYVVCFPFTGNPAAINWKRDMMLSPGQQAAAEAAGVTAGKVKSGSRILCAHPYLCEALHIDWFDPQRRLDITPANISQMKPSDIIIWENWFAVVESKISKADLDNNSGLVNVFTRKTMDRGHEIIYSVYLKREAPAAEINCMTKGSPGGKQ